jgi:RalA-binding protein 1
MTVRNVGIVFSPTLNIPAPVFSMFLTEFDAIFGHPPDQTRAVEVSANSSLTPEDIRSPRNQMFSQIPTPAYNQSSFPTVEETGIQRPASHDSNELGFIPIHPTYDSPHAGVESFHRQGGHNQLSSVNRMLAPSMDSGLGTKARRRESSMLFMDLSRRKSSMLQFTRDQSKLGFC